MFYLSYAESADKKQLKNENSTESYTDENHREILRSFDLDWRFGPCKGIYLNKRNLFFYALCENLNNIIRVVMSAIYKCIFLGLERLARWKRAEKFNLNPPKDVKELLEENRDNKAYGKRQGSYSLLFRGGGGVVYLKNFC